MITRMVAPGERSRCDEIFSVAFDSPMGAESYRKLHADPIPPDGCTRWASFLDDDTTMVSKMVVVPMDMTYEGGSVRMAGIGGVATLPPYRRLGGIRSCFAHVLPWLYREGWSFSTLYPFSHSFYRQFGYDTGMRAAEWTVRLARIPRAPCPGSFHLLEPGSGLEEELLSLHARFEALYNGMTRQGESERKALSSANPFTDRRYTYLYRDAQGTPAASVTFIPSTSSGVRFLDCRETVFTTPGSLRAVLQFFSGFQADYLSVRLRLPTDVPLLALLPEGQQDCVRVETAETAMVRVVRAGDVLSRMRGTQAGDAVIAVTDDMIPDNTGTFRVSVRPGGRNLVTRADGEEADLSLDIRALSRLAIRREDLSGLAWHEDGVLRHDTPVLRGLFREQAALITAPF